MKVRPNVLKRNLELADKIAKQNGGSLPNPWSLIQMGYGGLYRYIHRHSSYFEDFSFVSAVGTEGKTKRTTFNVAIRCTHLKTAQALAKKNKGKLPTKKWLTNHGYSKLLSYMNTYPALFVELSPEKLNGKKACSKIKIKARSKKRKRKKS